MTFGELILQMGELFSKYWKTFIIEGLSGTLILSVITVFFGAILGALLSLGKMSRFKPLSWLVTAFVEVIRGTPLLLQLFIGYFLLPMLFPLLELSDFTTVSVVLVLNSAAYVSEVFRSGIQAVDFGQTEAARSLGLGSRTTMISVVLPQAIKNILPALANEFVTVIKETSLASTFFVGELMTSYYEVKSATFLSLPTLMIVGIIYFVITFTLSKIIAYFEKRMKRSERATIKTSVNAKNNVKIKASSNLPANKERIENADLLKKIGTKQGKL